MCTKKVFFVNRELENLQNLQIAMEKVFPLPETENSQNIIERENSFFMDLKLQTLISFCSFRPSPLFTTSC